MDSLVPPAYYLQENNRAAQDGFNFKGHACKSPLCGKAEIDGNVFDGIVVDGVQGMSFQVARCTTAKRA